MRLAAMIPALRPLKTLSSVVAAFACLSAALANADEPFEAIVNSDSAYVHSGPDAKDYYATMQLKRGDKVEVVREDFGGWYMIKPPAGSFSWIRADYVDRTGDQGVVNVESAVDRIGSVVHEGDPFVVHRLSQGATVKIIGDETRVNKASGALIKMLKINPPLGEFRYINKRDVEPAKQFNSQPDVLPGGPKPQPTISLNDSPTIGRGVSDPFTDSPKTRDPKNDLTNGPSLPSTGSSPTIAKSESGVPGRAANRLPGSASEGIEMPAPSFGIPEALELSPTGEPAETQASKNAWVVLEQIDERFRQMIKQPVAVWNVESLAQEYANLDQSVGSAQLSHQVNLRLEAVERYQLLSDDYDDVRRIVSESELRDEEIRQSFLSGRQTVSTQTTPYTRVIREPNSAQPRPATPAVQRGAALAPQSPAPVRRPTSNGFDGAGIIRRTNRPGVPGHELVAPDGRLLAYLQGAPGIDLDRHVGQSFGLNGLRGFRAELNADFITVRRLTPVVLSR